jgi:xanthine dehydrogenase accessory factor
MDPIVPIRDAVDLYRRLLQILERREPLVLATVLSRSGSGPREAGAAMLVDADGKILGTVGGGGLEAQVIELARVAIRQTRSFCRKFILTRKQATDNGMICGGRMEVLLEFIDGNDAIWRDILARALSEQDKGRSCLLIRSIREAVSSNEIAAGDGQRMRRAIASRQRNGMPPSATPVETGLGLLVGDDLIPGSLAGTGFDRGLLKQDPYGSGAVLIAGSGVRYFVQPLGTAGMVIVVGAGHLSRALAPLCRAAGFRTVIMDDRAEFADRMHFPDADGVLVLSSFEACFEDLRPGPDHYVVIVTRGHEQDETVLAQALRTPAGYIGMIGSRRKREAVYGNLHRQGFTAADTARVHCPIGLAIGAQTPAEIAVSIAAELIQVRSRKRNLQERDK